MKKRVSIILICLSVLVIFYLAESVFISAKTYEIVKSSYNSYGENNHYSDILSDDIYEMMCYRNGYPSSQNTPNTTEINKLSFPITIHWIVGGKTFYQYTYEIHNERGTLERGSWHIPVTITFEFKDWAWVITDYYEAP